jgi:predicted PurR-regulated permease PerM
MDGFGEIFKTLFGTITSGGPAAVIALLMFVLIISGYALHYVVRLILSFAKDRIKITEHIISEKDKQIAKMASEMREIADNANATNEKMLNTLTQIQLLLTELKTRMELVNVATRSTKWRPTSI